MNLKSPTMVGFNISNKESFESATRFADGAIIGSAFVKAIAGQADVALAAKNFVRAIRA